MILNILVWIVIGYCCYYVYKKINTKIGDDPNDLTEEEKHNSKINDNKLPADGKTVMDELQEKQNEGS